ncbi:helix-turn-helix domain-containing protein [Treponema pectinovorum]|uniref:helix-turn-helix domain-containing protein n=1 Tax=Treponema pectinovorum TaxID=164 RepID=UPI0011C96C29
MYYTTKSPCLQRLNSDKGKWVGYQLRLRGVTQTEIAARAGCSQSQVSNVLAGRTSSSKVYIVLCDILGFSSLSDLLAIPRRGAA